jgi:uncharacterized protein (TIGR03437 family)
MRIRQIFAFCAFMAAASAQQNRISRPIDERQRTTLTGHIHPKARPENDRGRVSPSLPLSYVTLMLAQSESQRADLEQLLSEQQTSGSPNYHRWLAPEEYAQRFGVSEEDLNKVAAWLQGQGLTIAAVARGRNWIAVNGSVAQIENAFHTEIREYFTDGETHFANAAEPSLPAALAGVVRTVRGLNDFRSKPAKRVPRYTSSKGNHYLAPDDLAAIYNMMPLYSAGIDGTGQTLVIAGQTQINLSDIQQFRSTYNLPANDPQIVLVPNSQDPGINADDLAEADLDLEWSGAVARNATILYVYAPDVMQAVQYAIDQNLAPVVSTSYGSCELESSTSDVMSMSALAKQGNAQGITWFAASGDNGGADCGDVRNSGLAVDMPASIPEVTGVGGTEFQEGSGQYWKAANDGDRASAVSYIPETAWNDSAQDGQPSASGGGASVFFPKPSWQAAPGVPTDNARHVPDVSLTASADHDGYLVYSGGSQAVYGGTSVPTPAFAGIATLLNQYLVSSGAQAAAGLGNMNPGLYSLAQTTPDVFHDITTGDNVVTVNCPSRFRTCGTTPAGYSAGAGYDQTTGLGSVDASKLIAGWNHGTHADLLTEPSITSIVNAASFKPAYAPGSIAAVFGSHLAPLAMSASNVPLPTSLAGVSATVNGIPAPLYYLSSGQLNIQIPYETPANTTATLSINNNGLVASQSFTVSRAAPAIFTSLSGALVPNGSAGRGQIATLYITGAGIVTPVIATGAAPSSATATTDLPKPASTATVTVGGLQAPIQFIGITPGLVGVMQINYQVPAGAAIGTQPVAVAIDGISSPPASLTVTTAP